MRKRMISRFALCILLAFSILAFTGCKSGGSDAKKGTEKTITVTITHKNGEQNVKEFTTSCEFLKDAMAEQDLLDPSLADGTYYTVVDGETADTDAEEWWCLTIDGEQAITGFDDTKLEEGKNYEITFTEGW